MPFLTLTPADDYDPVTILVEYSDGDGEVEETLIGDPGEYGVHGTYISSVRARKLGTIPVVTCPLSAEDATAAREVLRSAPPLTATGEWLELLGVGEDGIPVLCGPVTQKHISAAAGRMVRLKFTLTEA